MITNPVAMKALLKVALPKRGRGGADKYRLMIMLYGEVIYTYTSEVAATYISSELETTITKYTIRRLIQWAAKNKGEQKREGKNGHIFSLNSQQKTTKPMNAPSFLDVEEAINVKPGLTIIKPKLN